MVQKSASPYKGYGLFLIPGLIIFVVIIVIPFLTNIYVSFTKWTGVGEPTWIALANYTKAFGDSIFWTSFKNNVFLILALTTIPTLIGLLLAAFLSEYIAKKFGTAVASFFRAGFYLPQIIPVIVAAIVWRWILQPDWGVLNTVFNSVGLTSLAHNWLGDAATALPSLIMMLIWFQIGYPLVIFMAALQRVDPELYEAASIDGATWIQKFRHISIPLIRSEIFVVILTTTIYALKTFGPIFAMTKGGPGNATMVASYFSYKNFFENSNVGYGATMATVLTLIVMVITIVSIRVQSRQEQRETL
jgi:raffinose/stachyose/melibiose transport system permease protein